jgi:hypothetical protein
MRTTIWLSLAASSLLACKWTEFDDLANETWVSSTKKPNVSSTSYGIAIQRGGDGRLAVIGAGPTTYSELVYDTNGDSTLGPTTLDLNAMYGIANLDPQPILLADPSSDDIALIANGGSSIAVLTGTQGALDLHSVLIQPSTVDAATYMQAPPRIDAGHAGELQPIQPLVASGDVVLGTFYANPPDPQPTCMLTDSGTNGAIIQARALGTVPNGASDDVLAWGASGTLYRYSGDVFNGCTMPMAPAKPIASVDTGFMPGRGSQILTLDATHVVLQGHHETDDASFLQVYDVGATPPVPVGTSPVTLPKLRTAAIFDANGTRYVVAGYPTAVVGTATAGAVQIFKVTPAGLDAQSATLLSDAQPVNNQSFGRAVAVMPFQGKQVIAVAADNEIFVYFRVQLADGTPLYDDTRQGR